MKFTKMHGIGNDYVYVDCFQERVKDPGNLAAYISDRHFGVGSDGLILICPSDTADCRMEMYNSDGSRGAMCGNGIRCVAKYAYEHGICRKTDMEIETDSGIKKIHLTVKDGYVTVVSVNMGKPVVTSSGCEEKDAKTLTRKEVWEPISAGGQEYSMIAVSMGNPHAVLLWEDVDGMDIEKVGPLFENHRRFPDRTNTEFIKVLDRHTLRMRVWERGAGETLACGTGACAAAAAASLAELVTMPVTVKLLGGDLTIDWQEDGTILMTGPAAEVFRGELDIKEGQI